ncbi:MAG: transcriptional regulator [Gammaproteobacteria bacterium RIFCSPLOWO2_12_47_11]|nr:MAG: transcriptional regulator [Gammaproteobacteria bacterium RIFCSPLOWO2_12_47_11]
MALVISRFDIFLVSLDPVIGHEVRKTRPCVIISPDEMNHHIGTVIIAPMTTKGRDYPTRIPLTFKRKKGQIVLDQIRTIDKTRLVKRLGKLDKNVSAQLLEVLQEMFME